MELLQILLKNSLLVLFVLVLVDVLLVFLFLWLLHFGGDRFGLFLRGDEFWELELLGPRPNRESAGFSAEVCGMRDVEDLGSHDCHGCDEGAEKIVLGIEDGEIFGGSFGEFPERFAFFGLKVQWIGVKKLFDVVFEVFVELFGSVSDAVFEIVGSMKQKFETFIKSLGLTRSTYVFWVFEDLLQSLGAQTEEFAELISGPFHTMKGFFWEHFEGAMRNFSFLLRIALGTITFGFEGQNDLNVSFRTQSAAF